MERWRDARAGRPGRLVIMSVLAMSASSVACSTAAVAPTPVAAPVTLREPPPPASVEPYRDAGFLVGSGEIPFVGLIRFAATEFLDSTSVFVALSLPPRSLSFVRAGDRYAAFYSVRIQMLVGGTIARSELPSGEVRVASFSETTRADEGVLFQRMLRLAPGAYTLRLAVQDSLGAATGTVTAPIVVPALRDGAVAVPIPVFAADPRRARSDPLTVVANPRSTIRYGRDSSIQFYVEGYEAAAPDTIILAAFTSAVAPVAADTVVLPRGAGVRSATGSLPAYRLGLGAFRVVAGTTSGAEIAMMPARVTVGVDLPVTTIDDLVASLKYFASDPELQRIRSAAPQARPNQWAELMRRTDPNPSTPENEAFLEYARRLRIAAADFREGITPGWQTDRGGAFAALGEPDSRSDPQPADSTGIGRVITWDYRRHRLLLVFVDADGSGTWRLSPVSAADFRSLLALSGLCLGCR